VDPAPQRANELAKEIGVQVRIETSVDKILGEIDGAVIATPNHLHARLAIECLEARVPVLIEKPLAVSVSEGEQIRHASTKAGVVAAVGYVTRFRSNVQLMRTLLESNYFGAVRRFAYQTGTIGGWAPLSGYNLDRSATGGGVLVVTGTHFLDRMLYWFGYPDRASLVHDSLGGPEANAFATFSYENNLRGVARFSKTVRLPTGFVMETEAGTALLGEGPEDPIRFWPSGRPELEVTLQPRGAKQNSNGGPDLFRSQLEDFVAAARHGHSPKISVQAGIESLRLLDELYSNAIALDTDWYCTTPSTAEVVA
jgi:predicted dehydrogenase